MLSGATGLLKVLANIGFEPAPDGTRVGEEANLEIVNAIEAPIVNLGPPLGGIEGFAYQGHDLLEGSVVNLESRPATIANTRSARCSADIEIETADDLVPPRGDEVKTGEYGRRSIKSCVHAVPVDPLVIFFCQTDNIGNVNKAELFVG